MISDSNSCNKDKANKNRNKDKNKAKDASAETEPSMDELLNELETLDLSMDTILVFILAIALNYYYVYYSKVQVLDQLNNTNFADSLFDASKIPRIANAMIIYGSGIFLEINYRSFVEVSSVKVKDRDENAIAKAYRAFFSSILVFIAAAISRTNLEV